MFACVFGLHHLVALLYSISTCVTRLREKKCAFFVFSTLVNNRKRAAAMNQSLVPPTWPAGRLDVDFIRVESAPRHRCRRNIHRQQSTTPRAANRLQRAIAAATRMFCEFRAFATITRTKIVTRLDKQACFYGKFFLTINKQACFRVNKMAADASCAAKIEKFARSTSNLL